MKRVAGAFAALLLASACALSRSPGPPPRAAAIPTTSPAPPCGSYDDGPPTARTALEERAWLGASKTLHARGLSVRPSSALDRAARLLAEAASGPGQPLARARIQRALRASGAWDPAPTAHLASGPPDEALAALLARVGAGEATHLGVGEREEAGEHRIVLLLSRRRARLDRFPGAVAEGSRAVLGGELLGLLHPRAFVTRPDGTSEEVDLRGGRSFTAAVHFPKPGLHVVEVTGTGDRGPAVAALLAVSVGGAPCAVGPAAEPAREPAGRGDTEASVLEAVDALRTAHGLAPVQPSPEVAALALAHSERMLATRTVAHVLGSEGDLAARLAASQIPFRHAWENVASGGSALDAHAATEESPAHRANLLSPTASRIGVGVARGNLPTGEPVVYLTEILVEPPADAEADRLTLDARVREALWKERARRALPPLTNDLGLEAIAREASARMRAGDSGEIAGLTEAALRAGRRLAAADAFIARDPEEALRSRNLTDARFRRVGVGVAVGDSRRFGPARLFIAVVYGD